MARTREDEPIPGEPGPNVLSGGSVPVPDPTVLTTQLVDRAITSYREVIETRLAGMDQATKLLADALTTTDQHHEARVAHIRSDIDRLLHAQRELMESKLVRSFDVSTEKFMAIDTRFQERDTRTAQAADESRISLDAALAAAKEAVSEQNKANTEAIRKSELATQKQIDALVALMATANKAADDKTSDLKERLDRAEGLGLGRFQEHSESRLNIGSVLLLVSVLVAVAGLVIAVALRM